MRRAFKRGSETNNRSLEIEASRLKERLDKGEDVFILDVRTQKEYEAWRLSYGKYKKTPIIPIDRLVSSPNLVAKRIPKNKEIVTLCAHGHRSQMAAQILSKMGYKAKSIKGGMAAWNQVYDFAEVPLHNSGSNEQGQIRIWQLRRMSKGCMAYVIASGNSATVIDSTCDLDSSVLQLAEENNLKIVNVIDTHMHADHISGLASLAKRTGAQAYFSAKEGFEPASDPRIDLIPIINGHKIPIGEDDDHGVSLTAIHAPGHTEGSMCFVLNLDSQTGQSSNNYNNNNYNYCYLFTGDTIFVNGVGRPDLHDKAKEYATKLYETYHDSILKYPDETLILPAHFDTNLITIKHGELVGDTIGSVKRKVKLLSIPKNEFIEFMVASVPPRPANYQKIIQINKRMTFCEEISMRNLEEGPNLCAISM